MPNDAPKNGTSSSSPPRGKGRPRLGEGAEIDEAIRAAALKVLIEQGESATLGAIAQAAGLSRRSIYARYTNKSQLFVEVIGDLVANHYSLQFDESGSADDRLYNCILAALGTIAHPFTTQLQRLMHTDPIHFEQSQPRLMLYGEKLFFEPICTILKDGVRSGEFAIEEIDAAARMVVNILFAQIVMIGPADGSGFTSADLELQARSITNLLTRGFHPRFNSAPTKG